MKIEALHVGMRVRHPQYGVGVVKAIAEATADVQFDEGKRTVAPEASGLEPAEAQVAIRSLEVPLEQFVKSTTSAVLERMGYEPPETVVQQLGPRWHRGKMLLHPADAALQAKEIPLEVFFHKIVGLRNQLRVLEQKINAHPSLSDADKVEMQQYISRCHGSLTTFNLLFKDKQDQFSSKAE
jgi:hypothetical protein